MSASPLSSVLFGRLFADQEIADAFTDDARLKRMLAVEAALARAEGRIGIIPADAAERIAVAAERLHADPGTLAEQTARDGVPVPALLSVLREAVGDGDREYIHWGATSQDIVDTAFALTAKDVLTILERRIVALSEVLAGLADRHRKTVMPGRTRFQPAVPITFGAKVASWIAPLLRHRDRLEELAPRLFVVSLAGAAGTQSALGKQGPAVEAALADELRLGVPIAPWHAARDAIAELAGWLSLVTGTLGKIGMDVLLLAQAEVGELRVREGGGSSTMPHKSNPVAAELLVTLARFNAGRAGSIYGAMVHANERDGSAWMEEWLDLPEMMMATGTALTKAKELIAGLVVNEAAMRRHAVDAPGLMLSEAAVYALARHMPKSQAEALVKDAIDRSGASGEHLIDALAHLTDAKVDWPSLRGLQNETESGETVIDRVVSRFQR
jgi:3-carboxy-cis,cis-muconate cycloisomerase